jgi:hypothetical protein
VIEEARLLSRLFSKKTTVNALSRHEKGPFENSTSLDGHIYALVGRKGRAHKVIVPFRWRYWVEEHAIDGGMDYFGFATIVSEDFAGDVG